MKTNSVFLTVENGVELFVRQWLPDGKARAALQIVHGMAEHSARYAHAAERLCAEGIAVFAMDIRGHGLTANLDKNGAGEGGLKGHPADKNAVRKILGDIQFIDAALRAEFPRVPVFLMGHSWGSFLTQSYIENCLTNGAQLAGCVLSGTRGPTGDPIVALGGPLVQFIMLFKHPRKPSRFVTSLATGQYQRKDGGDADAWLSRDTKIVEETRGDPLFLKSLSVTFFRDLGYLLHDIHRPKNMRRIPRDLPVYIFAGSEDGVGSMGRGPKALAAYYTQKLKLNDVKLTLYEGARHECLNETNREEVENNLVEWLNGHLA